MSNKVKIYADLDRGAIIFDGPRAVEPKFLGTLAAELVEGSRIKITRSDRLQEDGVTPRVVFKRLNYTRVQNKDGDTLSDTLAPQGVVDYLNTEFNKSAVTELNSSSFTQYDVYANADYTGDMGASDGSALRPYTDIQDAVDNAPDGANVYLKGDFAITSHVTLPADRSIHFFGGDTTQWCYAAYASTNGKLVDQPDAASEKKYSFDNIRFINAGEYAIYIRAAQEVNITNCEFKRCGWSGNGLSTTSAGNVFTLGYDSAQADLQAFWAGTETSEGGAMNIRSTPVVNVTDCELHTNLRGLRVQDCGIAGAGVIARNRCYNNIDSGIYLAAANYGSTAAHGDGCENFSVYNNYSANNANNGILVIGGENNIIALNRVEGNWNAGVMLWNVSDTRARDMDLDNNNRSNYNGIGNVGDAQASVQISGPYMRSTATFLAEILDTTIHYSGMGSAATKNGIMISDGVEPQQGESGLPEGRPIIAIDDCAFVGQDHGIVIEEDADNLRLSISDCRYTQTAVSNVLCPEGSFTELPFSNMHMDAAALDFSIDPTGSRINVKEGGKVIQSYGVNELKAVAFGSYLRVVVKDSNRIQWDSLDVATLSIDGTSVNSVLAQAVVQLNDLFTNTSGFASGGNPVTAFVLAGDNLTLTLQDGTSYTVDVTTLGVDENKFVSSGALSGSNLVLTMNDSSTISIDATNMINGSQLPARANDWYIAYGNNAGDEIVAASIVATYENKQPFYNGSPLEKGEEFVWTHDNNGTYILGVYTGAEETSDELEITYNAKWSHNFKFSRSEAAVRPTSVGVDVSTRYAGGYGIDNNTVFALRYGHDNHLYLLDISGGGEVIIGKSDIALVGDSVTIFMGGENQPNAKFPVMVKRYEQWTIVHDFDNSENGEWLDGVETDTVIRSNMTLGAGQKMLLDMSYFGRSEQLGLGYTGASTGVNNAYTNLTARLSYNASELLFAADTMQATGGAWTWNQNATYYHDPNGDGSSVGYWNNGGVGNLGLISFIYKADNTIVLYHEGNGEEIATLTAAADGSPLNIHIGFNEAHPTQRIPDISRQDLTAGSQPTIAFAPDISDQSFDITEGAAFNVQIALDSGSDIVNQYGEQDAPSWAVLNQATGVFNGTAPAFQGNSDDTVVIACKAANALGGSVSFNVTLNVKEITYTNTKSLNFGDGDQSYLGGNAALVTSLERSGNGSGASEAWSISMWYKASSSNSGQVIFYYGHADTVNNGHIEVKQTNHNGLKRIRLRYGTNGNHIQFTTPSGSLTAGTWQHILVTYDGGTTGVAQGSVSDYYSRFKIYIDGALQTTSNSHSNYGYSGSVVGQNFRVGRLTSGLYLKDARFNQLAIWNSDQSANSAAIYNSGNTHDLSLLTTAPQHYYEIETSTTTVSDLTGTAHLVGYNFDSADLVDDAP